MKFSQYKYAWLRLSAMLKKECIEIIRDYVTYLLLVIIPFLQIILFGYIINTEPKHLPTAILTYDHSPFVNSLIQGFKNTEYFNIISITQDEIDTQRRLRSGKVQFVITIPSHFSNDLVKNKHPHILVEGDGTDPMALGSAFNAANSIANHVFDRDLNGSLASLKNTTPLFYVDTHALYNPAITAQYHTLPGLLGAILTVTLVTLTSISITSEYERGTLEMLLITPIKKLEIILGKIIPNLLLGYLLLILTVIISTYLFQVPFEGSFFLFIFCAFFFISSNLSFGLFLSAVSQSQLQAVDLSNVYLLPALLLSGFMFPFYAMPIWAQWLGNLFPVTHFMRITTEIMLKKATFTEVWPELWPILLFTFVIILISIKYFRNTLD